MVNREGQLQEWVSGYWDGFPPVSILLLPSTLQGKYNQDAIT